MRRGTGEYILRVAEAKRYEAMRGKVRIPERVMEAIGVDPGDVIEITGRRTTVAIVWPAFKEDEGDDIIRMDGIIRKNAGVSIGERVIVRRADAKPAVLVKFAPGTTSIDISRSESSLRAVRRKLLDYPLMEGDLVPLQLLGAPALLYVAYTKPSGPVIITEETKLVILERSPTLARLPKVTYEDIGGMKNVIDKIRELVELPLKHPELFRRLGIEPPKGILLIGPPGCGKTLLAKAVATESDAYFIAVNGPEIMSKFYGESEQRLREIFEEARKHSPSIIFIDEIDAIAPKRDEVVGEVERRVVAQLLTLMDGLEGRGDVIVIGATNRPHAVDPALRRPGRFDREIEILLPDKQGRLEILQIHTRNAPLSSDVNLRKIAEITHGYTGADLAALVKEAAMSALRRILPKIDLDREGIPAGILEELKITMSDFLRALREVSPSGLREVLVEVPEVRWGDIGGLEEVKQQLREAVEWPLKRPDSY
ncbi:MAG: AAA family ATPase, partial [Thermoprotei archaeon]